MKIRRNALTATVAALLVVTACAALLFWLPNLMARRIAARIEARTGVPARVEGVAVRAGSVSLDRVVVGGAVGDVAVRATHVVVHGSPLRLAFQGSRAVSSLDIETLDVRVPMQARGSRALVQHLLAGEHKANAEAGETASDRTFHVGRLSVLLSDEHGELLQTQAATAEFEGGHLRLAIDRLRAGQQPGGQLVMQRIAAQARRGAGGFELERASVANAMLWLPAIPPAEVESAGAIAGNAPARAPRSVERVLKVVRAVMPAQAIAPNANAKDPVAKQSSGPFAASSVARGLARFTDDALLTLDTATVYGGADAAPVLQQLRTSLKVQPEHVLLFSGRGTAQGAGAVRWDLVVRPDELRADGDVEIKALPLSLLAPMLPSIPWYRPDLARVDAALRIKTAPEQGVSFSGDANVGVGAIVWARSAPTPVRGIDIGVRGSGRLLPLQHRLEISESELSLKQASVRLTAAMEWSSDHYRFDVDAQLPPTPCTDVVQAISEDILGDMAVATWRGKLDGELHLRLDSRQLDQTTLQIVPHDHCQFETVPVVADLRRFGGPFVHSVQEPDGKSFEMETGPGTAAWTDIEQISPLFVHAVLAHEDAGFFSHHGFSMRHIREALIRNLQEGRYVVGASTITMQLVKNVFLHREKTLARKIQEVLMTWWVERVMKKRDIIELYLNVIEYGPQVYGIRNAARHYFSRLPSQLSPAESVYLATILPNPKRFHQQMTRGGLKAGWTQVVRKMLVRLGDRGSYSPETVDYGLAEIEHFRFAPEGSVVPPRTIPGWVAPLPYRSGADTANAAWAADDSAFDPGGGDDDRPEQKNSPALPSRATPYGP